MSESIRVLDLRDYWRMIRTRIWTVLAMATIVAAIAGAYVALRPPTYYSQAKVIVDPLVNPAITGTVGNPTSFQPDMVIESEIVGSIDIARAVREDLSLSSSPEEIAATVRVEPLRDAAVMYIGYLASQPETAATIANSFAEQYLANRKEKIDAQVEAAIAPMETERDLLAEEAGGIEAAIEASDDPEEIGRLQGQLEGVRAEIAQYGTEIAEIRGNASTSSGGSIVQFATAPRQPSGPSLVLASILGFIVGAIIGAGLAILLGLRANRVGGRDELAEFIGAPVMGVIPTVDDWSSRDKAELVTRDHPGGPAAEAYRTLATNIRFLRSQRAVGVVVVTSALPGEGKSATTANLAVVLAETGVRTLLIDTDLRRPRAERFLGVPNGAGLREALEGSRTLDDVVLATEIPNLSIVRSGAVPDDPVSLLAGPHADSVFHDMRRLGDIVICDAPPTLPVADASILAEVADVVLFVHDPAISSRTALEDAVRQLRTAGGEIAGGVYNNITTLQRNSLGYASYDQYYGPDDRSRARKRAPAIRDEPAAMKPSDVPPKVEPPSGNGSGAPPRERAPASTPGEQADR
ncbi:MAG TPA: polysaccharide biosynthesis tyrosine autokinase [Actinomycetota bacterium]|nr:polysaccharide biosynthesis tyrosine autokinase [Actinomycetota bacterium]